MIIKRYPIYALPLLLAVFFVSCWDNFEERSFYSANIDKFGFSAHDTCPYIQNYVFNIDQLHGVALDSTTGIIQNLDSLPYGSVVNSLLPNISFQSTNGNIYVNDSLWEDGDSIDFSKPVVIRNTSYDGVYTKSYTVVINVHQVDPDSMSLEPLSSVLPGNAPSCRIIEKNGLIFNYVPATGGGLRLYQSADTCRTWSSIPVTGLSAEMCLQSVCTFGSTFFAVTTDHSVFRSDDGTTWSPISTVLSNGSAVRIVTLYGEIARKYINEPDPSALIGMMITASGDTCFGRSTDGLTWVSGSKVPSNFPFSDYAQLKSATVTNVQFVTVAGGLDAAGSPLANVWSTEDGRNWISVNDGQISFNTLPKRMGSTMFRYNGYLVYFGGKDKNGVFSKDLWISPDHGKTWKQADEQWAFLKMDDGLAGAGVYVQHVADPVAEKDREFIWLVGGTRSDGPCKTIWKANLNSMIFARR
jgi:hypothetical protein